MTLLPILLSLSLISVAARENYGVIRPATNDSEIVRALENRKMVNFIQGANLVVTRILPEDTRGNPHQLWMARLSSGSQVKIIYNLDMGERVPLKVGDVFSVGGQFLWTNKGGLIHWTHEDPRKNRPDGYVILDGQVYGIEENKYHYRDDIVFPVILGDPLE